MTRDEIISAFSKLGEVMGSVGSRDSWKGFESGVTEEEYENITQIIPILKHKNAWFTEDNVLKSFSEWSKCLTQENLKIWTNQYAVNTNRKNVGVIMAGNIPLVGMHDLLSVVISGHNAIVKMSSDDNQLFPMLLNVLYNLAPELKERIIVVNKLEGFDAVIATGSNNTSRYFEAYFNHVPNIIRKNRTSVAIVPNDVTVEELTELGKDVFSYYGMGCRNVTKVYFEQGFKLDRFFEAIFVYGDIVNMNKYANNYDYHKALYLMNREEFLENNFLILKENADFYSPIGVLNYEYYSTIDSVKAELENSSDIIQCVVSRDDIPFGKSQSPTLADYADGVDTMKFLEKL